jgi:hypothetical protein
MSAHADPGPKQRRQSRRARPQQLRLFRPLHPSPHQRELGLEFIGRLRRTLAEAQPAG